MVILRSGACRACKSQQTLLFTAQIQPHLFFFQFLAILGTGRDSRYSLEKQYCIQVKSTVANCKLWAGCQGSVSQHTYL